jgi:hypothetical protein
VFFRGDVADGRGIANRDNVSVTLLSSGWVAHDGRDAGIRSAAAGQKLLAFEVSFGEGENAAPKFGKLRLVVSVDNATPRRLPLGHTALASAQRFVVGVPAATRAVDLALTDSGVTQRLSILTGKPSAGNVAVLRRADRFMQIDASGPQWRT